MGKKTIIVKVAQAGGSTTQVEVEKGTKVSDILAQAGVETNPETLTLRVGKKAATMKTPVTEPSTVVATPKIKGG